MTLFRARAQPKIALLLAAEMFIKFIKFNAFARCAWFTLPSRTA